jgi:UDP-N-acetylmuramate dehydrogenase
MSGAGAEVARGADLHLGRVAVALEMLGDLAKPDVALGPLTTYRVGGAADVFVRVRRRDDLDALAWALRESSLPVLVVGRGSNLLVADAGFRGIAVSVADITSEIAIDADAHTVTAGSGVLLPVLARRAAAAGLAGFEWAVGVPGSIGGAVRMNAGGHGSDIAASLIEITTADLGAGDPDPDPDAADLGAVDPDADPDAVSLDVRDRSMPIGRPQTSGGHSRIRTVPSAEVGLRFRGSALRADAVVLDATLQLRPGNRAASEREIAEIVAWRRANQPGGQNAGSVFVNPVPGEVSAGELIDAIGLRGRRVGSASVSEKHANFIQADEGGSADDVRALMRLVRDEVEAHTGYALRSEIRLVGFGEER